MLTTEILVQTRRPRVKTPPAASSQPVNGAGDAQPLGVTAVLGTEILVYPNQM